MMQHKALHRFHSHIPHRPHPAPAEQELMPGDVALARHGQRLKTLLGSCVSVILTDRQRSTATMCHIVHSMPPNSANLHNTAYASCAMDKMFHLIRHAGLSPTQCEAYLFGGGNMFPEQHRDNHVGERNAHWAWDFLTEHHIPIVGYSVGGTVYRKLAWTIGPAEPELITTDVQTGECHEH